MQSPSMGSAYQREDARFSGFRNIGSSSSPSYSERILSQSPNYSPASSRHSSPNYSPRGDSNRQENESIKENQEDEEHEEEEF